eukprot:Opistho-2@64607
MAIPKLTGAPPKTNAGLGASAEGCPAAPEKVKAGIPGAAAVAEAPPKEKVLGGSIIAEEANEKAGLLSEAPPNASAVAVSALLGAAAAAGLNESEGIAPAVGT